LMLTLINFKQPVEEGGKIIIQAQDKEVLDKMFYFLVFTPIAGWILGLITMNFYRYVGDEKQIIQEELMKLREAKIKMQG
jgi:Na+/melibiose symporter-like transporter